MTQPARAAISYAGEILLQWFWSSVVLTGDQTSLMRGNYSMLFWSSVVLTGDQTSLDMWTTYIKFWSSVVLTGDQTCDRFTYKISSFGAVSF